MVSSFLFIFAGMEKIYNYYQDIVTAYTRRADNLKKNSFARKHPFVVGRQSDRHGLVLQIRRLESAGRDRHLVYYPVYRSNGLAHQTLRPEMLRRSTGEPVQKRTERVGLRFQCVRRSTGKSSAEHSFSLDLDLFGNHSLFQSVNRTVTFMEKRSWPAGLCNHSPTRL